MGTVFQTVLKEVKMSKDKIIRWGSHLAKWYQFWWPQSGIIGGVILFLIFILLYILLKEVI